MSPEIMFYIKFENEIKISIFSKKHKKNSREPIKMLFGYYSNIYYAKLIVFYGLTMLIILIISWIKKIDEILYKEISL